MPVLPSSRDAFAADLPRKVPPTASPAAVINPWTVYAQGNYFGGNRDDRLSASGLGGGGGSYGSESGTIGLDYRLSPSLVVGAALNGATTRANLNQSGNIKIDSVQIAGYISHNTRNWFVDAVVAYGDQKFDIDRPGVIDTLLRGDERRHLRRCGQKAGYLFDLDVVRLGPIAGLRYAHTRIGDYTETGDSVLTQHVDRQIAEQLVGSVGAQFARSLTFDSSAVNGYLNLTAERESSGRYPLDHQPGNRCARPADLDAGRAPRPAPMAEPPAISSALHPKRPVAVRQCHNHLCQGRWQRSWRIGRAQISILEPARPIWPISPLQGRPQNETTDDRRSRRHRRAGGFDDGARPRSPTTW